MPTVLDIVDRSLELVKAKAAGQSSSGEDSNLGLRALISMLDSLQLDPHAILGLTELTYTPASGSQSVTIGTGGNISTTMPSRIDRSSFIRVSGTDYPLHLLNTLEEYNHIASKGTEAVSWWAYWNARNTNLGTLYLYPAINDGELHLWVDQPIVNGFASMTLATSLTLSYGYRHMLEYKLADLLTTDFGTDPLTAQRIKSEAAIALRRVKRANLRIPQLEVPYRRLNSDITSGEFIG